MITKRRKLGDIGEAIAEKFLMKRGFAIVERNHLRKWGELDIVAEKEGKLKFIEVKSKSSRDIDNVIHETSFRPEENVTAKKTARLKRVIQTYLTEQKELDREWTFMVAVVYIDQMNKRAKIKIIDRVVL
jgi:putative endonuclease